LSVAAPETLANTAGCLSPLPQSATPIIPFHLEHVVAKQHGGSNDPAGLALACDRCNAYKGPNLTSIDPETEAMVPLFHPRVDRWEDHFEARGGQLCGKTPIGRAKVRLLNINAPRRVELRLATGL
jgi:hypothetical protein